MSQEEGGKVLEFPTKDRTKKPKKKDDGGGDINIGCSGCGSGCLSWPIVLMVLAVLLLRGVTFSGHHYYLTINGAHGLELHDDEVVP